MAKRSIEVIGSRSFGLGLALNWSTGSSLLKQGVWWLCSELQLTAGSRLVGLWLELRRGPVRRRGMAIE